MNIINASDRLKYIRSLTGLNRREFARKNNFPEVSLRLWESAKAPLTLKGALRCADLFKKEGIDVSEEWILYGIGSIPTKNLEIAPIINCNQNSIFKNNAFKTLKFEANLFKQITPNLLIYFIENQEMSPIYNLGDYVMGIPYFENFNNFNNKDCILILKSGETLFRTLKVTSNNILNLVLNKNDSSPIYNAQIQTIAPIIFHRIKNIDL